MKSSTVTSVRPLVLCDSLSRKSPSRYTDSFGSDNTPRSLPVKRIIPPGHYEKEFLTCIIDSRFPFLRQSVQLSDLLYQNPSSLRFYVHRPPLSLVLEGFLDLLTLITLVLFFRTTSSVSIPPHHPPKSWSYS